MDSIRVKYENGVFKPLEKTAKLEDGTMGEVHVEATHKRPSVRSSEFFGLWKNREDITDGLSYTTSLRSKSRY